MLLMVILMVYFYRQAPLNTPVTEDAFSLLTKSSRIPIPLLPGNEHTEINTYNTENIGFTFISIILII